MRIGLRDKLGAIDGNLTACRAVLNNRRCEFACLDVAGECSNIRILGLDDIHALEVQTTNGCACRAEERCGQTLDRVAITANGAVVALNRTPSLACQIYISHEQYILVQGCCLCCKCLQRCCILYNKYLVGCSVRDSIRELTHLACHEWLLAVALYGCIHHATLGVVECDIELGVDTCRNCYVEVGRLAREGNALAKRVLDNLLRCLGCSSLTRCKVEVECAGDRLAVDGRNLRQGELCRTCNANLQDTCEVVHLRCQLLAVGVHCRYATCEGGVRCVHLLLCKEYLTRRSCRVGDAVRRFECACNGERCYGCAGLICGQGRRLNSVYRNLVALAPVERVQVARLLAELSTRLLERNGKLGHLVIAQTNAKILGCVGCARVREQRNSRQEKFC